MVRDDDGFESRGETDLVLLKWERQNSRISSFFRVINQIATLSIQETNLQTFLKRIFHIVCDFFNFDAGGIYLVDREKGLANLQYSFGLEETLVKKISKVDISVPPYVQIFRENKSIYTEHYGEQFPPKREMGIIGFASIPLSCETGVIGALNIASRQRYIFSEEQKQLLDFVGKECGTDIYRFLIQEQLRKSEEKYHNVVKQSYDGIILVDEQGKITDWNQGQERISGWSRDDVVGQNIWDMHYKMMTEPDKTEMGYDQIREIFKNIIEKGLIPWETPYKEAKICTKEGTQRTIQQLSYPIKTGKGFMLCKITRDITEQVAAKEALKASEESYRLLFEKASDIIAVIDLTGRVLSISPSVSNILGYNPEEIVGKFVWDALVFRNIPIEKMKERLSVVAAGVSESPMNYEMQSKNGHKVVLEIIATPIFKDGQVSVLISIARDVTARIIEEEKLRQIEQERQILLENTVQISELKSNLITQTAHKLKTPLTSILGWGDLLYAAKKQGKSLDENFDLEELENIVRNAERIDNIINNFLDVRYVESGKFEITRQRVIFNEILEDAIQAVDFLAVQKHITFSLETIPSATLSIDRRRMEQVLFNILSNAIKYSPEHTHVTTKTDLIEDSGCKLFKVQVIDEGYGFTPEELADAMIPFGKAYTQQDQKRVVQGAGLGLFISRRIVEQHGGILTIRSEGPNKGTEVEIRLPLNN